MRKKIFFISLIVTLFFGGFLIAQAQTGYEPLTEIPGLTNNINAETEIDLGVFLTNAYNFLIALAVVTAVVMITVGGFQYLTSAAAGSKETAKKRIWDSIRGLVLILLTYIILFTINPNTVSLDFLTGVKNIGPVQIDESEISGYYFEYRDLTNPNAEIQRDSFNKDELGLCNQTLLDKRNTTVAPFEATADSCVREPLQQDQEVYSYQYFARNEPELALVSRRNRTPQEQRVRSPYYLSETSCEESREQKEREFVQPYDIVLGCFKEGSTGPEVDPQQTAIIESATVYDATDPSEVHDLYYIGGLGYYSFLFSYTDINGQKTTYRSIPALRQSTCIGRAELIDQLIQSDYFFLVDNSCTAETVGSSSGTNANFKATIINKNTNLTETEEYFVTEAQCLDYVNQAVAITEPKYNVIGTSCLVESKK